MASDAKAGLAKKLEAWAKDGALSKAEYEIVAKALAQQ